MNEVDIDLNGPKWLDKSEIWVLFIRLTKEVETYGLDNSGDNKVNGLML